MHQGIYYESVCYQYTISVKGKLKRKCPFNHIVENLK